MNDIVRVVIETESGYCSAVDVYKDKVTITNDSIRYEKKPMIESDQNPHRKWSYKTNNPSFQQLYADLVRAMPMVFEVGIEEYVCDVGTIRFVLTYEDKQKWDKTFYLPNDRFKEIFNIAKKMVPSCEAIPDALPITVDAE